MFWHNLLTSSYYLHPFAGMIRAPVTEDVRLPSSFSTAEAYAAALAEFVFTSCKVCIIGGCFSGGSYLVLCLGALI